MGGRARMDGFDVHGGQACASGKSERRCILATQASGRKTTRQLSEELDRRALAQGVFLLGQTEFGGDHLGQGIVAQIVQVQAVDEQVGTEHR